MQRETNRRILLVKRPRGMPDGSCFTLDESPLPRPEKGQVLVRTKYISVDPYMRGRMTEKKSYLPPFALNEAMSGGVVGEVVESLSPILAPGDFVLGFLPWQEYVVALDTSLQKLDPARAPVSTALGVLGLTGLTAYFGMIDIGRPAPGETVVVSGAAGAVGIIAGQIAKIKGCRAVGIAGSDDKTRYLTDRLGYDAAINYKTVPNLEKALASACPKGVDIYFDNVGGTISDAVLSQINNNARIPLCGLISSYNDEAESTGPRIQRLLLTRTALMKGFLVFQYADRYEQATAELAAWVREDKLKYSETIVEGLENAPRAFMELFEGKNLGKMLVKVS
ncbi:MAG: NADP-dependent oxidoreductase [Spirochaetes bacterium]|nr:MAG: NADP-dependent oxidoreductase [Spirochaetota bacterium]